MAGLAWVSCSAVPLIMSGCGLVLGVTPLPPDGGTIADSGPTHDVGVSLEGGPATDANAADGSATTDGCATLEICNGIDDNCDGVVDGTGLGLCAFPGTTAECIGGTCVITSCLHPFSDCDGDPSNGCEADLSSPASCGDCSTACASPLECVDGTCVERFVGVTAGARHTCGWTETGNVWCWGENLYGQIGDGTSSNQPEPVQVTGLSGVVQVEAGAAHTCAVQASGGAWCWGQGNNGQLGDGNMMVRRNPVRVGDAVNVMNISAGAFHSCLVNASGYVHCWGGNPNGQLGPGAAGSIVASPMLVSGLGGAVEVTAAAQHTCARLATGTVQCWGQGDVGQRGDGTFVLRVTNAPSVVGLGDAVQVHASSMHTCARTSPGGIECWGNNGDQQLGFGGMTLVPVPTAAPGLGPASDISAGYLHTCAAIGGQAWCWGNNARAQLGRPIGVIGAPAPVARLSEVAAVTAGEGHSCALLATGAIWCWGLGTSGQLGNGDTITTATPVAVILPTP